MNHTPKCKTMKPLEDGIGGHLDCLGFGGVFKHVCSVLSDSLGPHRLQPSRLLFPQNFPDKNTGAGCHFLPHGTFPTQGLNCISYVSCIGRQILYLCHLGSPSLYIQHQTVSMKERVNKPGFIKLKQASIYNYCFVKDTVKL